MAQDDLVVAAAKQTPTPTPTPDVSGVALCGN